MKPKPESALLKSAGTKLGMWGHRHLALLIQHGRTSRTFTLSWHSYHETVPMFHSDIASLDKFGYCRIEGRIKDMIIRGGENIYPAEIEQFLHTHPKVQEAQVTRHSQGVWTIFFFNLLHNLIRKSEKWTWWTRSCTYAFVFHSAGLDDSLVWAPWTTRFCGGFFCILHSGVMHLEAVTRAHASKSLHLLHYILSLRLHAHRYSEYYSEYCIIWNLIQVR